MPTQRLISMQHGCLAEAGVPLPLHMETTKESVTYKVAACQIQRLRKEDKKCILYERIYMYIYIYTNVHVYMYVYINHLTYT